MIKKLQKYLLLHYPVIWNIRLVPMLLILIAVHLMFFMIGYFSGESSFDDAYYSYYSPINNMGMLYLAAVLVGILVLIGWLVLYMRNNAFRIFYPRKISQLYLEWILIFVITLGLAFIPYSLTYGKIERWRSVASKGEAEKNLAMLKTVKMLIPDEVDDYNYKNGYRDNTPIPIPNGTIINMDNIDLDNYSFEYNAVGSVVIKGYKGPSFLFYGDYDYSYYRNYKGYNYHSESPEYIEERQVYAKSLDRIRDWLTNRDKDSIISLMSSYLRLQDKHNLKSNIDLYSWFNRVYNPPYFPVSTQNKINTSIERYSDYHYYRDNEKYMPTIAEYPFFEYQKLVNGYERVVRSYDDIEDVNVLFIICLCVALAVSVFIFSFRVTSGKSWLIAFIGSGVIIFISSLINVAISEAASGSSGSTFALLTSLFWIFMFIALFIYLYMKVKESGNKGRSNAPMNIFLWLVPCVCPFIYMGCYAFFELNDDYYERRKMSDYVELVFMVNALITAAAMWFVVVFVRKWKSIPEE